MIEYNLSLTFCELDMIYKGLHESITKIKRHLRDFQSELDDHKSGACPLSQRAVVCLHRMIKAQTDYQAEKEIALKSVMQKWVGAGFTPPAWLAEEQGLDVPSKV